jgi:hypothetical protein
MNIFIIIAPVVLTAAVLGIGVTPAMAQSNEEMEPVRIPGGVAQADGDLGFVENATGGIDALNLANGDRLWTADTVTRPILATAERLYALDAGSDFSHSVRVAALDTKTGQRVLLSEPIKLPVPIPAGSDAAHHRIWRVHTRAGELVLSWQAQGRYVGGAAAPAEIREQAARMVAGSARIDSKTGKLLSPPGTESVAAHSAAAPEAIARDVEAVRRDAIWVGPMDQSRWCALTIDEGVKDEALVLTTWDPAKQKGGVKRELIRGSGITPLVTEDRHHVLIRSDEGGKPSPGGVSWTVYSLEDGRKLPHSVVLAPSATEPTILGDRLFAVLSPTRQSGSRTLLAVDLKSGRTMWTHPISGRAAQPARP